MRKKHKNFKSKLHRKFACFSFKHMENQHEHELASIENKKIQEHKHAMCTSAGPHPMPLLDQAYPDAHRVTESLHLRHLKYT
jgi:hypothetical protein